MMTKKTKIIKHTFILAEVLEMVIEHFYKHGYRPIPIDFVEIRARKGTSSILFDTLEVKYKKETTEDNHKGRPDNG